MELFVLCDAKYRNAVWCDIKLKGIMDEATRRRIQPKVFTSLSDVKTAAEKCTEEVSVILLFDSITWLENAIEILLPYNPHFIVSANYVPKKLPVEYSLVGTDADRSMRDTVNYLYSCNKKKIALVGINRDSCNDMGRTEMFEKYVSNEEGRVFYIEENMYDSFDEFFKVQEEFDAAVCTNDLVAICLVEYLKKHERKRDKLFVISHTDTVMARLYGDGITSVTTNFYDCGRLLVETYFNRLKHGLSSSHNLIPATLNVRGSTDNILCRNDNLQILLNNGSKEKPKPIVVQTGEIGRLERLLATSDLVNFKLMYCLICGYNYDKMSEYCFISSETARYRVRKIKTALAVSQKREVAELVRKYIKKESLLAIIAETEEKNNRILV